MSSRSPWPQDFDFYEGVVDERRAFFLVDVAAFRHAPLLAFGTRIAVRVPMRSPRADGLRSDAEKDALFALEDGLVDRLNAAGAIYVGRYVTGGQMTLVFYAQEAAGLEEAVAGVDPYTPEVFVHDDPSWSMFLEFMGPDLHQLQGIRNRRLLRARAEHGDRPEAVREVDHVARFPTREGRDRATTALEARGFRVDPPREPEPDDGFWLEFHRAERLDGGRPDEFVAEVLDVLLPLDGDYDGWGALVVT